MQQNLSFYIYYLDSLIHHDDTQLLLVVEANVKKTGVWERRTRDEDATGGSWESRQAV